MFWTLDGNGFRRVPAREAHEPSAVCLHAHSCHSTENLAQLNWVSRISWFRPFSPLMQRSFGLAHVSDVDYRQLCYHPPFRPDDIWRIEFDAARRLGFSRLLLAITDHDEVAGSIELHRQRPDDAASVGLGEELSVRFEGELFHVGVSGIAAERVEAVHASLRALALEGRVDEVFELLKSTGCLVVVNHPLIAWGAHYHQEAGPVRHLIDRYRWAIDALEFNAMRSQAENRRVVELAKWADKPLVGGGDSHLLTASSALCASNATTYAEFIAEVRSGWSRPIVTREYFLPHRWKITLRVLSFIAQYRAIGMYGGVPVQSMLGDRSVLLDPIGKIAGWVIAVAGHFGGYA